MRDLRKVYPVIRRLYGVLYGGGLHVEEHAHVILKNVDAAFKRPGRIVQFDHVARLYFHFAFGVAIGKHPGIDGIVDHQAVW